MTYEPLNEQQLADLFSEQLDRLLDNQSTTVPNTLPELQELLDFVAPAARETYFQPGAALLSGFEQQVNLWFGSLNGGSTMSFLGLSKFWLLSIVVSTLVVVIGGGFFLMLTFGFFFFRSGPIPVADVTPTTTVEVSPTVDQTPVMTGTATVTVTTTPAVSPTVSVTPEATAEKDPDFVDDEIVPIGLCQGAYQAQNSIINFNDDMALDWEVVEGNDLVDDVLLTPDDNAQVGGNRQVKLDIKVKVKQDWWGQPDQTKIKVKLKIKEKGRNRRQPAQTQLTIVNQRSRWVQLGGYAYFYQNDQTLLLQGNEIKLNDCTFLPPDFADRSNVRIIGLPQKNGTLLALNIFFVEGNGGLVLDDFTQREDNGGGSDSSNDGNDSKDKNNNGGGKGGGKGGDDDDDN